MNKLGVLWISIHPPVSYCHLAGNQTYNYYYHKIKDDNRFSTRLLCVAVENERDKLVKELNQEDYYAIFWDNSLKNKIKHLQNIESKYSPFNRHCNLVSNYVSSEIIKKLKIWEKEGYNPAIIILEWTNIVVLAKEIKNIFPKAKLVASEHDVTFVGYERKKNFNKGLKRLFWFLKFKREKKLEINSLSQCELILPHNYENIKLLENNGISSNKLQSLIPYYHRMTGCKRTPNKEDILFFGAMSRKENVLSVIWFIENVMPLLKNDNMRFIILGGNPSEELKKYASDRVVITGFVESITPYFEQSFCFVAPLVLGAGIKVKVIEALSSGIPVLSNSIGIEGIDAKDGIDYIHCEKPEDYYHAIMKLKKDDSIVKYISSNAQKLIENKYSYELSALRYFDKLYQLGNM